MKLPEGYSAIFTQPFNRFDLPFMSSTGIMDLDTGIGPGAVPFAVKDGFNGFKIQNNEPEDYVKKIQLLSENKNILQFLSKNASNLANSNYDAISNTFKIEKYFYLP
jgi:hypothetical protein